MRGRKPVVPPLGDVVDLPTSSVRVPDCPPNLKGREIAIWNETAAMMVAQRIYDLDCKAALATYCVQYARFLKAEEQIRVHGETDVGARGGPMVNAWVLVSNHAFDRMVRLAAELGLTPVSRKRVARIRGATTAAAAKYLKRA